MPSPTKTKPTIKSRKEGSLNHPADRKDSEVFTKFVGTVKAKPQEQLHMSLGSFTNERPAKGFSIELSSEESPETVITQIVSQESAQGYEMILQLINYGNKAVSAEIWQI